MQAKILPIAVLVAALAGLAGSGAWADEPRDNARLRLDAQRLDELGLPQRHCEAGADNQWARRQAQSFADRLDLKVAEVIQFTNNYYARLGAPWAPTEVGPRTMSTALARK